MFDKNVLHLLTMLAGILFLLGFVPYIRAILRKTTKPAKVSWIIWAILDSITFAGMAVKETLNGQIIGAVIGVWIVAALALKYGASGWTKLDKFCLGGAVLGVTMWYLFDSPTLGITVSNGIIFLGAFPTFASAWRDPSGEDKAAWTIYWLSCVASVLAIPAWTLADAMQPLTFFVIESVVMYLLFVQPKISHKYP